MRFFGAREEREARALERGREENACGTSSKIGPREASMAKLIPFLESRHSSSR